MNERVRLEIDGAIATITNDNPAKLNAFDDEMDALLFEILEELAERRDVRVVIWRGEGRSWSSGRDVSAIGANRTEMTHHELMSRGHKGIQQIWELDAPVIVALQGWAIGGSFQRALLCDIRIASDEARFRLPEISHGVIPDTGGVGVLYEMCGHGLVSDMVLTGRVLSAQEALMHGIVSRVVARHELDDQARRMAETIAAAPAVSVKLARRVLSNLARPQQRASMADELIFPDVPQPKRRLRRTASSASARPTAALHRQLAHRAPQMHSDRGRSVTAEADELLLHSTTRAVGR